MFEYYNPDYSKVDLTVSPNFAANFNEFIKSAITGCIAECIDQLFILRNIKGREYISNFADEVVQYESIEKRFFCTKDYGTTRLNLKTSNYEKLAKDLNMIINVLKAGRREFFFTNRLNVVTTATDAIRRMAKDEEKLLEETARNEKILAELKADYEEERVKNIKDMEDLNREIQKVKFELQDVKIYGRIETAYFEEWEKSRREQNLMVCEDQENVFRERIEIFKEDIVRDNQCHEAIIQYFKEAIEDYKEEINVWMQKNDDEMEKLEQDTQRMKIDLENITKELEDTEETYKLRKQQMADWLEYKRQKKIRQLIEMHENEAALKIQVWWREVMMKKHLGPYRKKKKKGGKNKKK